MSTTPTPPSGPVDPDKYATIKPVPEEGGFYQNLPGVYCQKCGETFALYSYSLHQPDGVDAKGKPFYRECSFCRPKGLPL